MLKTATIFQDKMVLQRQKPVFIWGTQTAGTKVTAKIQGKYGVAHAGKNGHWTLSLPPLEASEDEQLIICSGTEQIIFNHVAIGEVWLAGGQSNMELWMKFEAHRDEELADCPLPRLRFFDVPEIAFDGQAEAFDYSRFNIWREATAEDLDYFSAVAYHFQKELSQALDMPIGIIGCNWGGTTTSAWMNAETTARVGNEITLCFDHAEGGLYREGDELQDLRVISEGKELSYTATIQNDQLLLTFDQLEQLPEAPVHIEFATTPWICVNLYNYAHIPAVPFRIEC